MTDVRCVPIDGHLGYEVSSDGRVFSFWEKDYISQPRTEWRLTNVKTELEQFKDDDGRVSVHIQSSRAHRVHTLVLEAFVSPKPEGLVGCHWDGDASNNNISNLRWDTYEANEADKIRHGRDNNGDRHGLVKECKAQFSNEGAIAVFQAFVAGCSLRKLHREYLCSRNALKYAMSKAAELLDEDLPNYRQEYIRRTSEVHEGGVP